MGRWLDIVRLRWRSLVRRTRVDRELSRELRFHLEQRVDELVAEGMPPAEARVVAGREFGSLASIEQQCRETRRVHVIAHLLHDLRDAWRLVTREPMLALAAATSIALGVGVNLSIFGVGNTLLFSEPTAARPDQLVTIRTSGGSHTSYPVWHALNDSGVLAGLAGVVLEPEVNWRGPEQSVTITPLIVSANYFDLLGVPILLGRGFTAAEADASREPKLAVLGHGFWTSRLGANPAILGGSITLNGEPYTVLGVLPPGVRSAAPIGVVPDVYVPISRALRPSLDRANDGHLQLIGRLHDGQSLVEGHTSLAVVAARTARDLGVDRDAHIRLFSPVGQLDQAREFKEVVFFFLALMVVTVLVLTIACANVAGLLLARSTSRGREIAVRLALGATRGRLVQQLLTEGFVLSTLGVGAGLLLTAAAGSAFSRVSLPLPFPIEFHVDFTGRVFWLAAGLVVLSALLCGLTPALHATRPALVPALKRIEPSYGHRRFTIRGFIVMGQVAISVVLLVVTLLFIRNLGLAHTMAPGFAVERTIVADVIFVEGRQGTAAAPAILPMLDRVRALPGVTSAAFADGVPLTVSGFNWTGTRIRIEGHDGPVRVDYSSNTVSPGYFETMGIAIRRGRDFNAGDRSGSPSVVVINEEFARRYIPDANAVGRHLSLRMGPDVETEFEIIGVVANSKYRTIGEERSAAVYFSYAQRQSPYRRVHVIAATSTPAATAQAVRAALLQLDSSAAVEVRPMSSALAFAFVLSRIGAVLMGALGVLGAILATIGLYGVVAFDVGRRTAEIAVRVALGASRASVVRLVLAGSAWLAGVGIVAGLALALVATPLLSSFLVADLSTKDPLSFAGTAALVAVTSLLAAWRPARRAARIEPATALRSE